MVDTFLSGWGKAEGKTSRYIIECDTYEEAEIVAENARNRSDMKKVSIVTQKPSFNKAKNHVAIVNKETASNWFKPNYFKKEK